MNEGTVIAKSEHCKMTTINPFFVHLYCSSLLLSVDQYSQQTVVSVARCMPFGVSKCS